MVCLRFEENTDIPLLMSNATSSRPRNAKRRKKFIFSISSIEYTTSATGRAAFRRHPDAKQTGKRENRHRKVLALFLRRFSFFDARGKLTSFPRLHAEILTFTTSINIAYRVQGQCPWCGVRGRRGPAKSTGAAEALRKVQGTARAPACISRITFPFPGASGWS